MTALQAYLRAARAFGLRKSEAVALLLIDIAAVFMEVGGVAMLIPVFQFMKTDGDLSVLRESGDYWDIIIQGHQTVGVPVSLTSLLAVSFILIILRQAFIYLRLVYRAATRQRAIHRVRVGTFDRFLAASNAYQHDVLHGSLIADVTVEIPRAINAVYDTVLVLGQILLIGAYTAGLLSLSVPMTVVSLVVLGLTAGLLKNLMKRSASTSSLITQANQSFGTFLAERLRAARLIRLSGTEATEQAALTDLSGACRSRTITLQRLQAKSQVLIEPVAVAVAFGVIYIGYTWMDMPVEVLGIFILVLVRLMPVIKTAVTDFQTVLGQWASLAAIMRRLTSMERNPDPKGGSKVLDGLREDLVCEDVHFAYGDGDPALRGVSLRVPAGTITALVGPSGAGKSTLIDLLPRLRDPSAGRILIDGVPLTDFTIDSLRAHVAYVPQQPQIFNGRLIDHIRYGHPEADEQAVREAARLAGVDEFVDRLPDGYDTILGEGGNRLSGGQRQRLDLARALVRRAPLLILDEPASSLDADSEARLRDALHRIRAETTITVVVVAHGLGLVDQADQIVVLQDGRVIDHGTPSELMARPGWYHDALHRQRNGSTAPDAATCEDGGEGLGLSPAPSETEPKA